MRLAAMSVTAVIALTACKSTPQPAQAVSPAETESQPAGAPATEPAIATPVVVTDGDAEQRTAPSGKARVIKFATGQNAFFGKLEMDPGGKVPVHRDATEEYLYILEGSGIMTIDGKQYEVGPKTAVYMPANAEVSFAGGNEKLVAIQVFAGPAPAAKYDGWTTK